MYVRACTSAVVDVVNRSQDEYEGEEKGSSNAVTAAVAREIYSCLEDNSKAIAAASASLVALRPASTTTGKSLLGSILHKKMQQTDANARAGATDGGRKRAKIVAKLVTHHQRQLRALMLLEATLRNCVESYLNNIIAMDFTSVLVDVINDDMADAVGMSGKISARATTEHGDQSIEAFIRTTHAEESQVSIRVLEWIEYNKSQQGRRVRRWFGMHMDRYVTRRHSVYMQTSLQIVPIRIPNRWHRSLRFLMTKYVLLTYRCSVHDTLFRGFFPCVSCPCTHSEWTMHFSKNRRRALLRLWDLSLGTHRIYIYISCTVITIIITIITNNNRCVSCPLLTASSSSSWCDTDAHAPLVYFVFVWLCPGSKYEWMAEREDAAEVIQKMWRGYRARQALLHMFDESEHATAADGDEDHDRLSDIDEEDVDACYDSIYLQRSLTGYANIVIDAEEMEIEEEWRRTHGDDDMAAGKPSTKEEDDAVMAEKRTIWKRLMNKGKVHDLSTAGVDGESGAHRRRESAGTLARKATKNKSLEGVDAFDGDYDGNNDDERKSDVILDDQERKLMFIARERILRAASDARKAYRAEREEQKTHGNAGVGDGSEDEHRMPSSRSSKTVRIVAE